MKFNLTKSDIVKIITLSQRRSFSAWRLAYKHNHHYKEFFRVWLLLNEYTLEQAKAIIDLVDIEVENDI